MSKPSKEFENRMQGMIYALNIAKSEGIEALESDIRKRGFTRAPIVRSGGLMNISLRILMKKDNKKKAAKVLFGGNKQPSLSKVLL